MANANEMARPFGKRPIDWLKLKTTKDYISALIKRRNCEDSSQFIKVVEGRNGGTWLDRNLAIEFARWLSPDFSIVCNDFIIELLTKGTVSINKKTVPRIATTASDSIEAFLQHSGYVPAQRPYGTWVNVPTIMSQYEHFCESNGFNPCSSVGVGRYLCGNGFDRKHRRDGNWYYLGGRKTILLS